MAENENVLDEELKPELAPEEPAEEVQPEVQPEGTPAEQGPTKGQKAKAAVKEWFRKKIVTLKRKTYLIPLVLLLVSTLAYLFQMNTISLGIKGLMKDVKYIGFFVFVNTLISVLVLVVFLSAFPKRKKPNIVALVGVFALMAVMIVVDILFYIQIDKYIDTLSATWLDRHSETAAAMNAAIIHIVFVGIALIALATLPLYKWGLNKINTRKVVESTEMKEEIDTSEEV